MPSSRSRRDVLRVCGAAFALGTAGCLGGASDGNTAETTGSTTTTRSSTQSTTTQSTTEQTTIPPSKISDEEAKERALAAEKVYVEKYLKKASCLENWGTRPTTASKEATVTGRTAEGVRVEVSHPYSYSTGDTEADLASKGAYLVTIDGTARISGDSVSPC